MSAERNAPRFAHVEEDGRVYCGAREIEVPGGERPELSQLQPEFCGPWPHIRQRDGATRDCRVIPLRRSAMEHVVILRDLQTAAGGIWNEHRQIGFGLEWNAMDFPFAWVWASGSGGGSYPLWGSAHVVGLEPAASPMRPFSERVSRREVAWLDPHGEWTVEARAGFFADRPTQAT